MLFARGALALVFAFTLLSTSSGAQATPNAQADTSQRELLRVFLDGIARRHGPVRVAAERDGR